jgi:hypothetical protein
LFADEVGLGKTIETAFQKHQAEMDESIRARMDDTRRKLFEHFHEDVHQRLRIKLADAKAQIDRVGRRFWSLTRFLYRLSHPPGESVLASGKALPTSAALISFNVSNHASRVHVVEALRGKAGYLVLTRLQIESYEREEYLLFSGFDDDGASLDQETMEKLFGCSGQREVLADIPEDIASRLEAQAQRRQRQDIFNVEDEIMGKRDLLIDQLERRLTQATQTETLFTIRWQVV